MPRKTYKYRILAANYPQALRRYYLIALPLSGAIAGSVFSHNATPWLLPFSLVPLIHYFRSRDLSLRQSLAASALFFTPMHAVVLVWFLQTDVSEIAGISTSSAPSASLACWIIMTLVLTFCVSPLVFILRHLRSTSGKNIEASVLLLPAGWAVSEWLRSVGFSIFLYGPGASIGDYWNFGSLGLAMMLTPFAHLSSYVGMYGLTFLVVLSALLIERLASGPGRKMAAIGLTTVILLGLLPNMLTSRQHSETAPPSRRGSVLQIEKQMPDFFNETPIDNYQTDKKDLVVLPEYSNVFVPGFPEFETTYVNRRLKDGGFSIDVSEGRQVIWEKWYGTLEFRNNRGELVDKHTKELLIPTGEYMPSVISAFYNLTDQEYVVENYNLSRKVEKGEPPRIHKGRNLTVGPVACSGILGRNIYRKHAQDGAEVFTNSASLLLFNRSESYFRQSLMMAKFHAIANSRTYIQATKGAPAFVIAGDGTFVVKPSDISNKFIDFSFETNTAKTPYTRFGEWPLVLSSFAVAAFVLYSVRKKLAVAILRRKKSKK